MKRIIRKYGPPIFHCINDFGQGSLAALIPFFIANFGLNYYQSASIIFCNTVVASVAQPILGYVADRWRVPWFIPVGFTVTLVSISAIALATSYEMILALSLIAGVGAALFHPEAALLVNRTQSNELGNAMGRFAVGGQRWFCTGPTPCWWCVRLWRSIPLVVHGNCIDWRVAVCVCLYRLYRYRCYW